MKKLELKRMIKKEYRKVLNEKKSHIKIGGTTYNYSDLPYKKCKRKRSKVVWEIWAADEDGIAIMNYSQFKPISRRVSVSNFIKHWKIVRS